MPGFSGAVKLDEINVVPLCDSTAFVPLGAPLAIADPGVCVVKRTRPDWPRNGVRNASIASLIYAVFGALGAMIAFATWWVTGGAAVAGACENAASFARSRRSIGGRWEIAPIQPAVNSPLQ